eukprot:SAG31_NODE_5312_length_2615_cov_1.416534_4_plen_209_part_00
MADICIIYKVAEALQVPVWSASSLRWAPGCQAARAGEHGEVVGCDAFAPANLDPDAVAGGLPKLFWCTFCSIAFLTGPMILMMRVSGLSGILYATHLFADGIHGVEMLYTAMGCGCETVSMSSTDDTDVCVGQWSDGRIGTFRGMRHRPVYGGQARSALLLYYYYYYYYYIIILLYYYIIILLYYYYYIIIILLLLYCRFMEGRQEVQ